MVFDHKLQMFTLLEICSTTRLLALPNLQARANLLTLGRLMMVELSAQE